MYKQGKSSQEQDVEYNGCSVITLIIDREGKVITQFSGKEETQVGHPQILQCRKQRSFPNAIRHGSINCFSAQTSPLRWGDYH